VEISQVLDGALRKAAAVWVAVPPHPPRLVWALWRDGALWVTVGEDQQVPGLADGVAGTVVVRSPTTHSHLVDVPVTVTRTEPDELTVAALGAARLNRPATWDAVYRLSPTA
jgi:hypothetical protein